MADAVDRYRMPTDCAVMPTEVMRRINADAQHWDWGAVSTPGLDGHEAAYAAGAGGGGASSKRPHTTGRMRAATPGRGGGGGGGGGFPSGSLAQRREALRQRDEEERARSEQQWERIKGWLHHKESLPPTPKERRLTLARKEVCGPGLFAGAVVSCAGPLKTSRFRVFDRTQMASIQRERDTRQRAWSDRIRRMLQDIKFILDKLEDERQYDKRDGESRHSFPRRRRTCPSPC